MSQNQAWSVRTVESIINQYPLLSEHPLLSDNWNYESGVMLKAIRDVYETVGDDRYFDYIKHNIDAYVQEDGSIRSYRLEDYNLDQINQGKILLYLYRQTGQEKYQKAIDQLLKQMKGQPRTNEGGYWHKKVYPFQMWLDGLYMAAPFLAEVAEMRGEPQLFDEAARQLLLVEQRTRDPRTGLLHHGYDECREQAWAHPEHGRSPHAWVRAIGWYTMAIVDVLDYMPDDHEKRGQIIGIYERLMHALVRVQDPVSGAWYQVLGEEGRQGNYLEASGTSMIVYEGLKALRKGYLSRGFEDALERGYRSLLLLFAETDENGHVHVHRINRVAGLGGNPYRDGSYTYYVNEAVVSNDPKGVGPFIMACLEAERAGLD